MFWIALFTIPTVYLTKLAVDYLYPGQLKKEAIKLYWNMLQLCSKTELKIQNSYKNILTYIPDFWSLKTPYIKFICDGDEIESYTINEFMKSDHMATNYDFILYEMPVIDNKKYNAYIFRYEDYKDIAQIEYNSVTEFNFLSIKLLYYKNNTCYTINFGDNYFLLANNILFDYPFLKWFLYKYHSLRLDETDKYLLSFIDHNMNYISLSENEYIIIRKNDYDIIMK